MGEFMIMPLGFVIKENILMIFIKNKDPIDTWVLIVINAGGQGSFQYHPSHKHVDRNEKFQPILVLPDILGSDLLDFGFLCMLVQAKVRGRNHLRAKATATTLCPRSFCRRRRCRRGRHYYTNTGTATLFHKG